MSRSGGNINLSEYTGFIPSGAVEIIETHISRIFLTPKFALKQKKPVNYGFVDYTSLKKRIFFARRELSLNRRACSGIYLDLQELRQKKDKLFIGFKGGTLKDVFVRMRRVNPEKFLSNILKTKLENGASDKTNDILKRVAKRIYLFHKSARTSKRISGFGKLAVYKENWGDNFLALEELFKSNVGTLDEKFYEKLKETEEIYNSFLQSDIFGEFIKLRVENGFIRALHGDLRMEHIAVIEPERTAGICLMDCVEFDERYRNQDLYLDIAFLLMDFEYNGFFYESAAFTGYYKKCFNYKKFIAPYEAFEPAVIPFFKAYRAIVRTKIALLSGKGETALKYFNLARFYLNLFKKPVVILNCGLSGSGKSAVSSFLSRYFYAYISSSDKIRQELYGSADKTFKYGAAASEHVYGVMLEEGLKAFEAGENVIFDATFLKKAHRERIIKSFEKKDCNFIFVYSKIYKDKEDIILSRLKGRFKYGGSAGGKHEKGYPKTGCNGIGIDYSEADAAVYFEQKKAFEEPLKEEADIVAGSLLIEIDASVEIEERFKEAMKGIIEKHNR
ncbi:MAG: bifunctional aminoglycoside phosphotransferase/ATP-binding protein [bacterium]